MEREESRALYSAGQTDRVRLPAKNHLDKGHWLWQPPPLFLSLSFSSTCCSSRLQLSHPLA